jgi:hypothetical protein
VTRYGEVGIDGGEAMFGEKQESYSGASPFLTIKHPCTLMQIISPHLERLPN